MSKKVAFEVEKNLHTMVINLYSTLSIFNRIRMI